MLSSPLPCSRKGHNAGTRKPNELDPETGGEGNVSVVLSNEAHLFAGTEDYAIATPLVFTSHLSGDNNLVSLCG